MIDLAAKELKNLGYKIEEDNEQFIGEKQVFESLNHPNPFNPITVINYTLPSNEKVVREIAELVNEIKSAGTYSVDFNASHLSSGVYFYSITAGNFRQVKKMVLAK